MLRFALLLLFLVLATTQAFADTVGIRHTLYVTFEPDRVPLQQASSTDIVLTIFLSAHSVESNFAGELQIKFHELGPQASGAEQEVWHDRACHQARGFPKITPIAVDATIVTPDRNRTIESLPRLIGKRLPHDELTISSASARSPMLDGEQSISRIRTASGFAFRLRLVSLRCMF